MRSTELVFAFGFCFVFFCIQRVAYPKRHVAPFEIVLRGSCLLVLSFVLYNITVTCPIDHQVLRADPARTTFTASKGDRILCDKRLDKSVDVKSLFSGKLTTKLLW